MISNSKAVNKLYDIPHKTVEVGKRLYHVIPKMNLQRKTSKSYGNTTPPRFAFTAITFTRTSSPTTFVRRT